MVFFLVDSWLAWGTAARPWQRPSATSRLLAHLPWIFSPHSPSPISSLATTSALSPGSPRWNLSRQFKPRYREQPASLEARKRLFKFSIPKFPLLSPRLSSTLCPTWWTIEGTSSNCLRCRVVHHWPITTWRPSRDLVTGPVLNPWRKSYAAVGYPHQERLATPEN